MQPPLSLYIHIPWCVRKCPYCDFNSHQADFIPEEKYVRALIDDIAREAELAGGRKIHSIFIGGGTPSLFKPESIARVLDAAERAIGFSGGIEITMEANPGTAEYSNLKGYRVAGVNRLSFGMQSFNNDHLKSLGRIHSAEEGMQAFKKARQAGFENINVDLMYGLPKQSVEQALLDLQQGIDLAGEHLSWYQLTVEPNTVFFNSPPKLPVDDLLCDMQEQGIILLEQAGFQHYEVSAYGKAGFKCKHNINYWEFGDYLAVGAGAHGKVTRDDGAMERYRKTRKPEDYMARAESGDTVDFNAARSSIPKDNQLLEFMMGALRLVDGVPSCYFDERTELCLDDFDGPIKGLVDRGLLRCAPGRLQATELGLRFLNDTLGGLE